MFDLRNLCPSGALSAALQTSFGSMVATATPNGNRLALEKSPYLQQHADNPIDWFPWGDEAFDRATREEKLIFLSIGYSTCHWCHVMERESFADPEVAAALNHDFVSIKVDREERPDIDNCYMQICVSMTGSGGWPLTLLLTPDKIPLFAGTYLPKNRGYNRPGLLDLLPRAAAAWRDNPDALREGGTGLVAKLSAASEGKPGQQFSHDLQQQAVRSLRSSFDRAHGGFGPPPKFPRPHSLGFLLQRAQHDDDPELLDMVETTLHRMRDGGIYDHLGFGFHRYATDREWLLPHFEKMLYDQAGLAHCYLEAWQLTGKPAYSATAKEIFTYLLRDMNHPAGGFYAAEDADSEGVEGLFYVWRKEEIFRHLEPDRAERFARIFEVRDNGNFTPETGAAAQGENILHRKKDLEQWALTFAIPTEQLAKELEEDRQHLFLARAKRVHPFRDDKILTCWNGMLISSLALGGRLLKQDDYLQSAGQTADFLLTRLRNPRGELLRRWRDGDASIAGFADDYAFLAQGLLDLYRATFQPVRLQQALELAERLHQTFGDAEGRIYDSPPGADLPFRTRDLFDGALPSTTSAVLGVYTRLFRLTGQTCWQKRATALLETTTIEVARYPAGYTALLSAASLLLEPGRELVIIGTPAAEDTRALLEVVRTRYDPQLSVLLCPPDDPEIGAIAPFTSQMKQIGGCATAYLCSDFSCRQPVTDAKELAHMLP